MKPHDLSDECIDFGCDIQCKPFFPYHNSFRFYRKLLCRSDDEDDDMDY